MVQKFRKTLLLIFVLLSACGSGGAPGTFLNQNATDVPPTSTVAATISIEENIFKGEATSMPTLSKKEKPAETSPLVTTIPEEIVSIRSEEQLINAFTAPSETNGEPLILYGQVLDVNGNPIPNTIIEIWQTDAEGIYNHPDDPEIENRDMTFQFFGATVANEEGWYAFRTILPGEYEPRPRHIHFKVRQNGETLLTSQFYFSEDIAVLEAEGIFQAAGESGDLLLLQLVQGDNSLLANGQIVVDIGIGSGELPLTPSQAEGPYYPLLNFSEFDNDLTILP